jgi:Arc/MetJ-type ribon-helix-helix transcriptional regulator
MKVSVSLPDDDVRFLDEYADERGFSSRSAAMHRAVELLRASSLEGAYEEAWSDWEASDDALVWDTSAGDGLN